VSLLPGLVIPLSLIATELGGDISVLKKALSAYTTLVITVQLPAARLLIGVQVIPDTPEKPVGMVISIFDPIGWTLTGVNVRV